MPGKVVFLGPDAAENRRVKQDGPTPKPFSFHGQIWAWATQVCEAMPSDRELVTVKVDGTVAGDFIPAVRTAAQRAGAGGYVVLSTDHGNRLNNGRFDPTAAWGFHTVPETKHPALHRMKPEALRFLEYAQKDVTGSWVPRPFTRPGSTVKETKTQGEIDQWAENWSVIEAMRDAFTTNGIDRLIICTCGVGSFQQECERFANLIGTTVVAYRAYVATQEAAQVFNEPGPGKMAQRGVFTFTTTNHANPAHPSEPFLNSVEAGFDPESEKGKWILKWWKQVPWFSMLPIGPVTECKPGATPLLAP